MSTNHFEENSKLPPTDENFRSQLPYFAGHPTPEQAEADRRERLKDPAYVARLRRNMGQRPDLK